jgi:hypothetical protein
MAGNRRRDLDKDRCLAREVLAYVAPFLKVESPRLSLDGITMPP